MLYIILAILMFGLLIAIHELGHFLTAKALGVQVNEFAIGMGPLLLKKQGEETLYSIRLLPIGGYCAMEGEDEGSQNPRAFSNAALWKRLIILVAGSAANFLIGAVIILGLYWGAQGFYTTAISGFMDGFAYQGEEYLLPGDEIVKIDGERVYLYSDIQLLLSRSDGESVDLVIRRDGQLLERNAFPLFLREYDQDGNQVLRYGLYFGAEEATLTSRVKVSLLQCVDFVRMVRMGLMDLITGRAGLQDLSGPIGIVDVMSEVGEQAESFAAAAENLLYFSAFIAINLAVMNMLPIPALDGGRVFFLLVGGVISALTHRRLDPRYEGYLHFAGFMLLIALMVVVAFNDVAKIVGR